MNLLEVLKQAEGKSLEFKRDLSSPDGVLKAIVAFSNTSGGIILLGVEDKSKLVRGIPDPLALEERLANLISDCISPILIPEIEILPWRKTHIVAVRIYPSSTRPHFLKSLGPDRGVFIRVGSTNRRADQTFIDEFKRQARNETFDEQPMLELSSEAIDFRAASECFKSIRQLKSADLKTLKLMTLHQGRSVPTTGGILLFGFEREKYFPDAWIQVGRFTGTDRSRFMDTAEIRRYPVQAIEEAFSFIKRNTSHEIKIEELRHTDTWTYPLIAIREALINAVVHADYAQQGAPIRIAIYTDRLEVENPGLLPFGITIDEIQQGLSKLRNRVIGRVFHALGMIEQWGSGIQRMISACKEAGLDPPRFEEIGTSFRVTFFGAQKRSPTVDAVDQKILDTLSVKEGKSTKTIAEYVGLTTRAIRPRLRALIERGLVVEIGSSPQDPRRLYFLRSEGIQTA